MRQILMILAAMLFTCCTSDSEMKAEISQTSSNMTQNLYLTIGGVTKTATLVSNSSTEALVAQLQKGDITYEASDYDRFDLLVGMDSWYIRIMRNICGGDPGRKIVKLMDFTDRPGDVADSWYTGDFEATWRDVLEGCRGILDRWMNNKETRQD